MRVVLVALAVAVAAAPVMAGENPKVQGFISFDPTCTEPAPYVHTTPFTAAGFYYCYVCFDCFGEGGGTRTVSFAMDTDDGLGGNLMALASDYSVFHATAQATGGPDTPYWLIGATVCVYPNECGIVTAVRQPFYVLAAGATISLGPGPVDGQMVVDCVFDADQFCVLSNGAIGTDPPAGDDDCDCETPVEPASWGSIKAMYR